MSLASSITERHATAARAYEGRWQAVVLTPDLASHQSFIVGVIVHRRGHLDAFRLLHDFRKLECIYGDGIADSITFLLDRARSALLAASEPGSALPELQDISPHLALTDALFGSGLSAADVLQRIYQQTVVLEPAVRAGESSFVSRDQMQVRQSVYNLLRQHLHLDFERVIKPEGVPVEIDGKRRSVDVDIFTGEGGVCGVITSGWYASLQTIELHALRGLQDLHAAHHHYHARRSGLVIVTPLIGLPDRLKKQVDVLLDKQETKVRASGLDFYTPGTDEEAAEIIEQMVKG